MRMRRARQKLRATHSPIFGAFYTLVIVNTIVSVIRCIVSMIVASGHHHSDAAQDVDRFLWIALRFFLLATEMSVVVFGVASGHLDSKSSIRRVVIVSSIVSLVFSSILAGLEFSGETEDAFTVMTNKGQGPDPEGRKNGVSQVLLELFGHGGSLFWMISSAVFALVYLLVLILPLLPCKKYLSLPHKRSFYYYIAFLFSLNIVQCVGSLLLLCQIASGLCFVNIATYLYFTAFTPIVYFTFVSPFFKSAQPTPMFAYKAQVICFCLSSGGVAAHTP